jgi:hypothetical protein
MLTGRIPIFDYLPGREYDSCTELLPKNDTCGLLVRSLWFFYLSQLVRLQAEQTTKIHGVSIYAP